VIWVQQGIFPRIPSTGAGAALQPCRDNSRQGLRSWVRGVLDGSTVVLHGTASWWCGA
jgi:hypothetical protein